MVRRILLDHIDVLIDGVRSPLVPLVPHALLGRHGNDIFVQFSGEEVPGKTKVFVEGQRFILGKYCDLADSRIDAVGESKINDPVDASEGNSRFCPVDGEGMQALAFAARQDHCKYAH